MPKGIKEIQWYHLTVRKQFPKRFLYDEKIFFKDASGRGDLELAIGRQFVFEAGLAIDLHLLEN